MRIVTGTISHETNVLSNIVTDLDEFRKRRLLYGAELFEPFTGTKTPAGGIIEGCRAHGFELVPTVYAAATPSGIITAEAFDTILAGILDGVRQARDIAAVVLHLHGAGVSEAYPDIEGVVKSSVHYRAAHEPIAAEVIELDTPGLTSPRLTGFGFKNIRRPIFPLDVEMLGITELKTMTQE